MGVAVAANANMVLTEAEAAHRGVMTTTNQLVVIPSVGIMARTRGVAEAENADTTMMMMMMMGLTRSAPDTMMMMRTSPQM